MFSFIKKFIDKLVLKVNFLNRENSPSLKQTNKNGDNIGRDKNIIYITNSLQNKAVVICAWSIETKNIQKNEEFLTYEFTPALQNKSENIIKDFWLNFSSSGFNLKLETTTQTKLFEGWDFHSLALNLVTKTDYRFAPQHFLCPFKIRIDLRKESVPNDAWMYISFGAPNVSKTEININVKRERLEEFIAGKDHSTETFLKVLGVAK